MSLADKILKLDDRKSKTINIPEWGGEFVVKELPAKVREDFEVAYQADPAEALRGIKVKSVIECLYDTDGNRVFNHSHAKALGERSASIIDRIFATTQKLSGLDDEAIEEAGKN